MLLEEGCTYPRLQVAKGTVFYAVTSNIFGSAVWKLLYITLLAPRFLQWLLDFWKIYGPVFKSIYSSGQHINPLSLYTCLISAVILLEQGHLLQMCCVCSAHLYKFIPSMCL